MIYTTKDLLKRALDLCDCANTDFLSNEEKERYLNESYAELYQKAIDRGDDSFVKYLTANSYDTPLPRDFYALRAVKSSNGYMYKRRPLNATINEPGYNIINGRLIISGNLATGAEVTYYPMPKHLTFQYDEKVIGLLDDDFEVCDNNGQYFVYYFYKHDEEQADNIHYVRVYDMLNETFNDFVIEGEAKEIYASKSTFFIRYSSVLTKEYSYQNGDILSENTKLNQVFVRVRNGLYKICDYDPETKTLTLENHEYVLDIAAGSNLHSYVVASPAHFYYVDDKGLLYEYNRRDGESLVIDDNVAPKYLRYKAVDKEDGILYYKDCPMIFSRGFNRSEVLDEIRQPLDIDYANFYGFTDNYALYGDGYTMYAIGNLPDVEMNYPNSEWFTLIAYKIALYVIAKQQGDVSILSAQYEKQLEDYFENATDQYMVTRITNVY